MSDQPEDAAELPLEERLSEAALAALMGDPYAVGLRVALDDGVAEAWPAMTRELAFLDRAVVAAQVGAAQVGVAGLAPASVSQPGRAVAASGAAAPLPLSVREEAASVAQEAAPAVRERSAAPAVPVSSGVRRAGAPMEEVTRVAERVAVEMVPVSVRQVAPDPPVVSRDTGPREAGRLEWGGLDWGRLAAVPGVAPEAAAALPVAMAGPPLPEAAPGLRAAASWAGPETALPSAAPVALPGPPGFASSVRDADGVAERATPRPESEPEAAPEAAEAERAVGGRLEIDGALLGRFVAEHLAREAGRPPSGMTGFDPRLSPEWAGALQG